MKKYGSDYRRVETAARYRCAAMLVLLAVVPAAVSARCGAEPVAPTFADVAYGPHQRNKLDFWQAASAAPTPLIVEIHGGGFTEGDKTGFGRYAADDIRRCLAAGVSMASINYRFIDTAPLQDIERDCARAIQFMRYKAGEWNLDRTRVASFGESAGAGTSLWMAFHDDLADPDNADPVLRESTRLLAAGGLSPQASYDFGTWPKILGIPQLTWFFAQYYVSPKYYHLRVSRRTTDERRRVRADLDILAWIDAQDPPVYLLAEKRDHWLEFDILHHPAHVHALEQACRKAGVECKAIYRETPAKQRIDVFDFLLERLAP